MWMPCQVMAVLCTRSAKRSTTFTVQAEMNRQPAFLGLGASRPFSTKSLYGSGSTVTRELIQVVDLYCIP